MKQTKMIFMLLTILLMYTSTAFADECTNLLEKLQGKWTYNEGNALHSIEFQSNSHQVILDSKPSEVWNCIYIKSLNYLSFLIKNDFNSYSIHFPKENTSPENIKIGIGIKKFDLVPFQPTAYTSTSDQNTFRWEPLIGMDGQVFPSLIIATATWANQAKPNMTNGTFMGAEVLGDANGIVSVVIQNVEPNTRIKAEVSIDMLAKPSVFEGTLKLENKTYIIKPKIDFDYQALLRIKQPMPMNIKVVLYVNDEKVGEKLKTVAIRSINDAPLAFIHSDGTFDNYKWMFAAYVNENHPWIDQLLREAINTGVINGFYGYQQGPQSVYQQVFAIWNMLQRRRVVYSSITTPTGQSNKVVSQYVRFLEDSIQTSQANCIDGTVLFASILRRIGINSQIVLIPGHAFLKFNLNEHGSQYAYLETTMIGNTKLSQAFLKNQASQNSFTQALNEGKRKAMAANAQLVSGSNPEFQIIDIEAARKLGVSPINH